MFDTMTITKVLGATCGSLLVFLLTAWAAESLYGQGEGHGEGHEQSYVIDTGAAAAPTETAEEGPAFDVVYAAADAAAGEKVFGKCKACHKIDGGDAVGPHLNGVVGRVMASMPSFPYSETLVGMGSGSWTPEELNHFLTNPKVYAPGTKMSFAGLPKIEDRANVIAYLATTAP